MELHILSYNFVEFRIDVQACKAFGKVMINYHKNDDPPFVESAQVHVACAVSDGASKWKIKKRLRKAAQGKLVRVETIFPQLIKNIFKV